MVANPPVGRSLASRASWMTIIAVGLEDEAGKLVGGRHSGRPAGTDDAADEIGRVRFGDLDLDESARGRVPVVDQDAAVDLRRLARVATGQEVLALLAGPFDQHGQAAADQTAPARESDRRLRLEQLAVAAAGGLLRHAAGQVGARRARLGAVGESAQMIEARSLDEGEEVSEPLLGLAREADDEGRPERDVRRQLARPFEEPQVALRVAAPRSEERRV